jgi:hypothetical protein
MPPLFPLPPTVPNADVSESSPAANCARIKELGYVTSKHITMYGEHFELISDPFSEGDSVAVHATCANDPTIRVLHLPVSILVGLADQFRKHRQLPRREPS